MILRILAALILTLPLAAGPREFGLAQLRAALAERGIRQSPLLRIELNHDPPQHWRIQSFRITGGDLAGLMYGLLEAADQIRSGGRLALSKGQPFLQVRAVRVPLSQDMPAQLTERWQSFLQLLARSRFNLIQIETEEPARHEKFLRDLSREAAQYAIEVEPRLWRPRLPEGLRPSVTHLQAEPVADSVQIREHLSQAKSAGHAGISIDALFPFEEHSVFYQIWGHNAYSPE